MEIAHIGYAVKNMDNAIAVLSGLGFCVSEVKVDERRSVKVVLAEQGG